MGAAFIDAWVNVVKDGFTAIAVPLTAYVAIRGLNTWQRQMKGTADYELMRSVLRAVYKVRDALEAARSPFTRIGEGEDYVSEDSNIALTPLDKVLIVRWNKVIPVAAELSVATNEAEVVWGMEARQALRMLDRPFYELRNAMEELREISRFKPLDESERREIDEETKRLKSIVYQTWSIKGDLYAESLSQAVRQIEDYVRAKVK